MRRREAELAVIAEAGKVTGAISDSRTDALAAALDALDTSYPDKPDPRDARIAKLEAGLREFAERECRYGDGCPPNSGTRHGMYLYWVPCPCYSKLRRGV